MSMTIDEAIQILTPFRNCMIDPHGNPISDTVEALDVAIKVMKESKSSGWIPIEEQLPPEQGRYLGLIGNDNRCVAICEYDGGGHYSVEDWWGDGDCDYQPLGLTAWRPLPGVEI